MEIGIEIGIEIEIGIGIEIGIEIGIGRLEFGYLEIGISSVSASVTAAATLIL
jgi:hypothetical protein